MGCYVNPPAQSKESWLMTHGVKTNGPTPLTETHVPVVLVNNGPFTAAAVGFSENEVREFSDPSDGRPKLWFSVPRADLYSVSDLADWEK